MKKLLSQTMSVDKSEKQPRYVPRFFTKADWLKFERMWRLHDEAVARVILRARGERPRPGMKMDLTVR